MANLDASIILSGANVSDQIARAQQPRMNALAMQQAQMEMGQAQQAQKEASAAKLARMVLSSPNPAQEYPRALQAAQVMGMDVRGMPQQWSPEVGEQLQMFANLLEMPKDQRTETERLIASLPEDQRGQALRVHLGLEPKAAAPELRAVGDTLVQVGPGGASPIYTAPEELPPAPSGYRWSADGNLEYIAGGPQDPAQQRPDGLPAGVQEYEYARSQGFEGTFEDWKKQQRVPGSRLEVDPATGRVTYSEGEVGPGGGKPLTEYQAKLGSLGTRMRESSSRVDETERAVLGEGGASVVDVIADRFGSVGNFVKSDEYRSYQQSAREWIAALLRLDSGAAVPDSEFERYFNTYFIAPGDDEKTVKLKKQARDTAQEAITAVMPPGMQTPGTQPSGEPAGDWSEVKELGGRRFGRRGDQWFELP